MFRYTVKELRKKEETNEEYFLQIVNSSAAKLAGSGVYLVMFGL